MIPLNKEIVNKEIDVEKLLQLMSTNPLQAADELDELGNRFHNAANELRLRFRNNEDGTTSSTGISEKVRMHVISPSGELKGFGGIG